MASIYNIQKWASAPGTPAGTILYNKNDIVRGDNEGLARYNKFFYATIDVVAENNYDPQGTNFPNGPMWGGQTNYNGSDKPHFFWKSSYNAASQKAPVVKSIRFGDGYEQRIPDGVNHNLFLADLEFAQRGETETAAILHFLELRGGTESFVFKPSPPYDKAGLYVCRNWSSSYVFYDNYSIKGQFEEVPE